MGTRFANREVCNMVICDYKTQKPVLNLDYANTNTTELTSESVFAYGGWNHPKRVSFNGEKGGTLTIETQMQSFELYSLITGADIEKTAKFLKREEIVAASADSLTLSGTPIAGTVNVFALEDDCGEAMEIVVENKTVTGDFEAGKTYVAYYMYNIASGVQKLSVKSTTFPKAVTIYGETYNKTEDEEILPYKMIVYKAAPQANITLSNSNNGDPTTLQIVADILSDRDNNMIDLILLDDEE